MICSIHSASASTHPQLRWWCLLALFLMTPAIAQVDSGDSAAHAQPAAADAAGAVARLHDPDIDALELERRLVPLTREELAELAPVWLQIVRERTEKVTDEQIALDQADGAAAVGMREALTQQVKERNQLFAKFLEVISAWEKKGGDEKLIAEYRAYRNAVLIEEARTTDMMTLIREAFTWTGDREGGVRLIKNLALVVGALLLLLMVARLVRRFARRWIERLPNLSKLLQSFFVAVIYWIVLAIGLMVVLSALGVDVSPVFALIGGASFILAFALQDTLGNLASGLMIMINRPFDEGDVVNVGGVTGKVQTVSIVATTVTTPDNQRIVIPNKNVWGNVITNVTASPTRRVDLVFGIAYEDSMADAAKIIADTVAAHPLVLSDPEPVIRVHELADSSVNFVCRPRAKTADYWAVYWDLTRQVKENFDAAGISIPYPQRDLHLRSGPAQALNLVLDKPSQAD